MCICCIADDSSGCRLVATTAAGFFVLAWRLLLLALPCALFLDGIVHSINYGCFWYAFVCVERGDIDLRSKLTDANAEVPRPAGTNPTFM
jgi:hypothetical protein